MMLLAHMVAKDLRRLRIPLSLWSAAIIAKLLFFAGISGLLGLPNTTWLKRLGAGVAPVADFAVQPLIAYLLVALLIFEDPPANRDSFWITRPISGLRLLAAKLIGAVILLVALPTLLNLPWWVACGFNVHEVFWSAVLMAGVPSVVVIVGMACAAATDNFPRYVLWTVVGLAAVATTHIIVSLALGKGVGLFLSPNENGNVLSIKGLGIFIACMLLVAIAIIWHQFFVRFYRRRIVLIVAVIVLSCGVARILPWDAVGWVGNTRKQGGPAATPFSLRIAGQVTYDYRYKYLSVPIVIDGVRPDEVTFRSITDAEWSAGGSKLWVARQIFGNPHRVIAAVGHILNPSSAPLGPIIDNTPFFFPQAFVAMIGNGKASFRDSESVAVRRGEILATLPLAPIYKKYPGGSFSISAIQTNGDAMSLLLTERYSRTTKKWGINPWSPRDGNFYYALIRRTDGALIDGVSGVVLFNTAADLSMVSIGSRNISFHLPHESIALDELSLVIIYFGEERLIDVALEANPFTQESIGAHHS